MQQPPTPRGGARGPAEVRSARAVAGIDSLEDPLPPGAIGADFKTLQAMIEKGLQQGEEDGVTLVSSAGGDEWGTQEQADELEWRQQQQRKREDEAASREKEREHRREQRRADDEERRRQQQEQLERELSEEKQKADALRAGEAREDNSLEAAAAARIQALYRGRQARAATPNA